MAEVPVPPVDDPLSSETRRQLVQRVLESATFERSKRLRDLLAYVTERSLSEPAAVIHESEIATAVFGKSGTLDAAAGSHVRVQASQLRKKLHQYFAGEGAREPVVVELGMGTYAPVFRERDLTKDAVADPPPSRGGRLWPAVSLLLLCACVALLLQNRRLRQPAPSERPKVDRLWKQMFGNGRPTLLVLADSSFTMFQDLIRLQLPPGDYQQEQLRALIEQRIDDPQTRVQAFRFTRQRYTSMADVSVARRIVLLHQALGYPIDVVLARDVGPQHFGSRNVILSGPRRGNPWVEIFEPRLSFRSRFEPETGVAGFENPEPQKGEPRFYPVRWDRAGYCRVAFLPGVTGGGNTLLLSGAEMSSAEAGGEFITTEAWVSRLFERLRVGDDQPVPHFEVLLRTRIVAASSASAQIVAVRTPGAPPR